MLHIIGVLKTEQTPNSNTIKRDKGLLTSQNNPSQKVNRYFNLHLPSRYRRNQGELKIKTLKLV
uniref:Uncharacterized protein n=1 Tax=Arundo donax TaxID=35708 RepID=A0A0A9FDX1_ARUDO